MQTVTIMELSNMAIAVQSRLEKLEGVCHGDVVTDPQIEALAQAVATQSEAILALIKFVASDPREAASQDRRASLAPPMPTETTLTPYALAAVVEATKTLYWTLAADLGLPCAFRHAASIAAQAITNQAISPEDVLDVFAGRKTLPAALRSVAESLGDPDAVRAAEVLAELHCE